MIDVHIRLPRHPNVADQIGLLSLTALAHGGTIHIAEPATPPNGDVGDLTSSTDEPSIGLMQTVPPTTPADAA